MDKSTLAICSGKGKGFIFMLFNRGEKRVPGTSQTSLC